MVMTRGAESVVKKADEDEKALVEHRKKRERERLEKIQREYEERVRRTALKVSIIPITITNPNDSKTSSASRPISGLDTKKIYGVRLIFAPEGASRSVSDYELSCSWNQNMLQVHITPPKGTVLPKGNYTVQVFEEPKG